MEGAAYAIIVPLAVVASAAVEAREKHTSGKRTHIPSAGRTMSNCLNTSAVDEDGVGIKGTVKLDPCSGNTNNGVIRKLVRLPFIFQMEH